MKINPERLDSGVGFGNKLESTKVSENPDLGMISHDIGADGEPFVVLLKAATAEFFFEYQGMLQNKSASAAADWAIWHRVRLPDGSTIEAEDIIGLDGETYFRLVDLATERKEFSEDVRINDGKPFLRSRDFQIRRFHFTVDFSQALAAQVLNVQQKSGIWAGYRLLMEQAFLVDGEVSQSIHFKGAYPQGFGYDVARLLAERINGFFPETARKTPNTLNG